MVDLCQAAHLAQGQPSFSLTLFLMSVHEGRVWYIPVLPTSTFNVIGLGWVG